MRYRLTAVLAIAALLALMSISYAATTVQKKAPAKGITLELTDTTVVEAFESLFKGTNLSFILQPGISGTIASLKLKDVTFQQALNAISKAAGLEVEYDDGIYIIKKPEPEPQAAANTTQPAGEGNEPADPADSLPPGNVSPAEAANYPQPAPYPDQGPVFYGHMPPPPVYGYHPGPYAYGGYGYGYYEPYRPMYVPPYQVGGSVMLPGPGVPWSAGIGSVRIIPPINKLTPR